MISVYNETKGPWKAEILNKNVLRFVKEKEKKTDTPDKKRVISAITYTQLFKSIKSLKNTLSNAQMTQEPVVVSDKSTAILFNNKEFKPIINEKNHNPKDILLGSIFLAGRRLIRMKNVNVFLLEFMLFGGEFSFIASFNRPDAKFTFDLYHEPTNITTRYVITQKEGKFVVTTTEREGTQKDKEANTRFQVFRPARPTHVILVHKFDREALNNVPLRIQHEIVEYYNLREAVEQLASQNYKAVTLFAKSEKGKESEKQKKRYDNVTDILSRRFQTVFKLHTDGKVDKVKY